MNPNTNHIESQNSITDQLSIPKLNVLLDKEFTPHTNEKFNEAIIEEKNESLIKIKITEEPLNYEDFTEANLKKLTIDEIFDIFPKDEINEKNSYLSMRITPDMARALITDEFMPSFQRDVNNDNKKQYISDIEKGYFDKSTITFGVVRVNGINQFYNIDGKTRLNAIEEGRKSLDFHVVFNSYQSIEEVRTAYTKIDSGRKRNFSDKVKAEEILKDKNVPKQLISKLGGIFSIINGDFPGTYSGKRKGANDHQAKIDSVTSQAENVVLYGKMLAPLLTKTKKECPLKEIFLNPGVAASIIYLMSRTPDNEAFNFFNQIIMDAKTNYYQKLLLWAFENLNEKNSDIRKAKLIRIIEKVWNSKVKKEELATVEITDYKTVVKFEIHQNSLSV